MIDELINRLDFSRAQRAMKTLLWVYFGEPEAPSIERLQAKACALLEEVVPTLMLASGHARKGEVIQLPELVPTR